MPTIELRGIVKNYGGVRALKGVDATIQPGQTLVLLGENGAGKSTLIKVLTGAVIPDAGEIRIDGRHTPLRDPQHAKSLGIAAVYQEPMTFPHMTVLENIFAGAEMTTGLGLVRRRPMRDAVRPWLAALDIPEPMLDRPMGSLGLGHKQLVLIAQALVGDAQVIIFDEPTSILSRAETDRLVRIIADLRAGGRAIVYITHRLEEVARVGDHVTVLTDGAVTGDYAAADVPPERLLQLMAGKSTRDLQAEVEAAQSAATDDAPAVLEVRGLSHPTHFRDVDWSIPAGTVTGIYGLVGAGRSEVALTIFGALTRSAGQVLLDGSEIEPRSPADAIAHGIFYLPEDRKGQGIFAPLSLESNLTAASLPAFTTRSLLDFRRLAAEADRIIGAFSIKTSNHGTPIATLSGGNQQKGLFARWASRPARVLILDEPTRGIDLATKEEIHRFIRGLAAAGTAVVVISSDLAEIMAIANRMIVMRAGSVVDRMRGHEMTAERVLAAAIGAQAA